MAIFSLKDSEEHYLALSDPPKRFDIDSPATNVFFDDTNGEVFAVRSGGVTGVTLTGMDDSISTSFRMEDKGPIISMKFSPDHKILAIQRNKDTQLAMVEFMNFQDLAPTNVEYTHSCKWKNAKILGFVWPKANEIAFITDHGIELLQVNPDKKQLKSMKNTAFSAAWFLWCAESNIVVLAGNNGALLQPFSLQNSTISKLQKIELESLRGAVERDVFVLRVRHNTLLAVFRHVSHHATNAPTEIWVMVISGSWPSSWRVLQTGLAGRFAISVRDHLLLVHHQSSKTSQVFDVEAELAGGSGAPVSPGPPAAPGAAPLAPVTAGAGVRPVALAHEPCPMYSSNWVVFQPDYIIDARLGCLWRIELVLSGLVHSVPKDKISKMAGLLLRREEGKQTLYQMLNQLVSEASTYLAELSKVFDEINIVYRKWADMEVVRNTAGGPALDVRKDSFPVLVSQADMCQHVLSRHLDDQYIVQVVTAYIASIKRNNLLVAQCVSELIIRSIVARGNMARLGAVARRGAWAGAGGEGAGGAGAGGAGAGGAGAARGGRAAACTLLALQRLYPPARQLALDMMWRMQAYDDIIEVLLSSGEAVAAAGVARAARVWRTLGARKLLGAAPGPLAFTALYRALLQREHCTTDKLVVKGEQCDSFVELYRKLTSE